MTFKKWILKFESVDLPIGDLARAIKQDTAFPDSNDREKLKIYLENHGAIDPAIETFEECWDFYEKTHSFTPEDSERVFF